MSKINIVIADDHATVRGGLKYALETDANLCVIGEAGDGRRLAELNIELNPDVLIVDINMPEINGIEAIKNIREHDKEVKILVITMHQSENYIREALRAGINGYLFKMSSIEEFIHAVHSVSKGEEFFGEGVSKIIRNKFVDVSDLKKNSEKEVYLTKREKEILRLIADGFTSQEIGEKLFLSHYTIENHRKNMIQKMGIKNTTALVRYAIEKGIITINLD